MTVEEIEAACNAAPPTSLERHSFDVPALPLRATFYPMGFPLEVRTNAAEILEMTSKLWPEFTQQYDTPPMLSDVYVAEGGPEECPPAPVYQFHRPVFTSIADAQHYTLIDMERRTTFTALTRASLCHPLYLEFFFLMMPMSTMPARGIHAACVALNERGVLLCGDSGAGKSTLAYACARAGWDYVSDDMSLLIDGPQRIVAGNCHRVRFRPTASEMFPEIRGLDITPRAGGKPSIELSTVPMVNLKRRLRTKVDFIVFLNRRSPGPPQLLPYRKDVALQYMQQGIYPSDEARVVHVDRLEQLLSANVLELRYSDLDWAIERLRSLVRDGC